MSWETKAVDNVIERNNSKNKQDNRYQTRNCFGCRYILVLGYCALALYAGIFNRSDDIFRDSYSHLKHDAPFVKTNKHAMVHTPRQRHISRNQPRKTPKRAPPRLGAKKSFTPVKIMHKAPNELRLPKPIINVGFPKAGTSSLFSFFHCNGLKSQHWYCCEDQGHPSTTKSHKLMSRCAIENLILNMPLFEGCGDFDVYSEINGPRTFSEFNQRVLLDDGRLLPRKDSVARKSRLFFPQHHQLDEIHKHYPNATLVLNQRPVGAWVDSVVAWDKFLPYYILNEFHEQNSTRFLFHSTRDIERNRNSKSNNTNYKFRYASADWQGKGKVPFAADNIRANLELVYNYHSYFIRKWIQRHPSHALVEVDITNETIGKILSEAFGLEEDCWGHFNKNDGKKKARNGGGVKPLPKSHSMRTSEVEQKTLQEKNVKHKTDQESRPPKSRSTEEKSVKKQIKGVDRFFDKGNKDKIEMNVRETLMGVRQKHRDSETKA